jgi:lactoylglutathione lyase
MELAFLGEGETKIELIFRGERSKEEHHGISMGFQVDSLEDTIKRLKGYGMAHIGEIMEPNPRVRFFFVKDPDGYPVQFVEIR